MTAIPLKRVAGLRREKVESVRGINNYVGLEHIESHTGKAAPNVAGDCAEGSGNVFQPGDVLFGKLRPYLAKAWLAEVSGVCTTEALVLQPRGIDPRYLRYFLLAPATIDAVDAATSGAKMPRADWDFVGQLSVPVTDPHIQSAIANFLDRKTAAIDAAIANKQTLIEDLQKYWEAVIMEAVAPREGWRPVRLKHLVRALPKSTLQAGAATEEGTVPFFVSGARVKRAAEALVTNGSAVVLATGGNATVHRAQGTFAYSTDCWALESKDSTAYLYFLLAFLKPVIAEVGFQGAGIKHLDKDWLLSLRVVLPSLGEQQAIAEELIRRENALQASIAKTEDAIAMLRRYKTSLIQEAVTGVTECC